MKQLLQSIRTGKTYIEEVPVPTPRPGTALVRTAASVVSTGTERMVVDFARKSLVGKARSRPDLVRQVLQKARREGILSAIEAALSRLDEPMPLGYSSAGVIAGLGEDMAGFRVGDRVACAGGGKAVHAEYALVPKNLLTTLPEGVDFESGAFTTLGAVALHGFRLSEARIGERVAVIGLGLLGQLAAEIARAAGCRVLGVDLDPRRVAIAEALGTPAVLREAAVDRAQAATAGRGFDAVLICADTPSDDPVELAGEIARDRATVVAVGAVGENLPRRSYFAKELTFLNSRSYGPGRYDPNYEEKGQDYPLGYVRWTEGRNMEAFVDLLSSGAVDPAPLITHRFPLEKAPDAYDLITGESEEAFLGVVLTYGEDELQVEGLRFLEDQDEGLTDFSGSSSSDLQPADSNFQPPTFNVQPASLNLGLLGAGSFAANVMLPAVRKIDSIRLAGIASGRGLSAGVVGKRFGFGYSASDPAELLADRDIHAIAVLTRHDTHAAHTLAALGAGKHVFCEKPLALDPEDLDEIEAFLLAHPEAALTVGFNRRFAPLSAALHAHFKGRAEPMHITYRVNAGYLPPDHWTQDPEIGGGRIIGEGCHFIDYLAYLVGDPPLNAGAQALPDSGRYREDNVQMTFSFADGSLGTVIYLANGDKSVSKERVEVFCGGRVAVLEDFRELTLARDGRSRTHRSRLRQDKGHRAIWEAFAESLTGGGGPPIPYAHLFGVTRASFAAVRSLRRGERVEVSALTGGVSGRAGSGAERKGDGAGSETDPGKGGSAGSEKNPGPEDGAGGRTPGQDARSGSGDNPGKDNGANTGIISGAHTDAD